MSTRGALNRIEGILRLAEMTLRLPKVTAGETERQRIPQGMLNRMDGGFDFEALRDVRAGKRWTTQQCAMMRPVIDDLRAMNTKFRAG